jgi:hypothetical protein
MRTIDKSKCESPIEETMLEAMGEAFHPSITIECQRPIKTKLGNYRSDFYIEANGMARVVEVDGRDFHEFEDDRKRDIGMLIWGGVREVFRFRGCDVFHGAGACVSTIRLFAPDLFDPYVPILSPREKAVRSCLMYQDFAPLPIVRCRLANTLGLVDYIESFQTGTALVVATTEIVAQFKSPLWRKQKGGEREEGNA